MNVSCACACVCVAHVNQPIGFAVLAIHVEEISLEKFLGIFCQETKEGGGGGGGRGVAPEW